MENIKRTINTSCEKMFVKIYYASKDNVNIKLRDEICNITWPEQTTQWVNFIDNLDYGKYKI